MLRIWQAFRVVALTCAVVAFAASNAAAGDPPNWRTVATGSTTLGNTPDEETFAGKSTHLGRFTGAGSHVLNWETGDFVGRATWTASNGDKLYVNYEGTLSFTPGEDGFFPFVAQLCATGGTGRLAGARGHAVMTGGFSFEGDLYFRVEGTLHPNGK